MLGIIAGETSLPKYLINKLINDGFIINIYGINSITISWKPK